MNRFIIFALLIFAILYLVNISLAAYPMTHDFEDVTTDLQNNAGGTGWITNWRDNADCGLWDTNAASLSGVGSKDVKIVQTSSSYCNRSFTPNATDGDTIQYWIRTTGTTGAKWVSTFYDTVDVKMYVRADLQSDGNIKVYDNLTLTTLQTYAANTIYEVVFTTYPSTEEFTIKINDTLYPSSGRYRGYNYTAVDLTGGIGMILLINDDGSAYVEIDDIQPEAAAPPAASIESDLIIFE